MQKKFLILTFLLTAVFLTGAGCIDVGGGNDAATSGPAGMFVSTDKGDNWTAISYMPTSKGVQSLENISVYSLVEDRNDSKALFWASREKGLFYTFDSGKTWSQSGDPLNVSLVRAVTIHPEDRCAIYATNGRQVFKTVDCVRSWEEVFIEVRSTVSITDVAFDPFFPENVYVSESDGTLLMSNDGGVSWSILNKFKGYIRNIAFDSNTDGLVFITTLKNGLFRSRDSGETWTDLTEKIKDYSGALEFKRFLVYSSKGEEIFWISKYGILTSRNAGEDWEAIKLVTPPGSVDIYSFTVNRQNSKEMYYTATNSINRSNFYRTTDGGQNWETRRLPSKQLPTVLFAHPENDGWLYLGFTIPPKN
ncbi:MAG: YCF48-related protein [Candidatus Magasanikbacteria bacterium]